MDKITKRNIGIGAVGVGVAVGSVLGYHYYLKSKTGFGIEKLPKMLKSRWQNIDSEYEEIDDYQNERPILSKIKNAEINKLYPQDYKNLPRTQRNIEKDLEEYERKNARRNRFTVFDNDSIQKRFKILETVGDPKAEREKGRLRVSGNIYRKDTPSGYNKNNRNANFSDIGIF